MRGSSYRALTGNILVFWISGRLWEVIAHGDLHEKHSIWPEIISVTMVIL